MRYNVMIRSEVEDGWEIHSVYSDKKSAINVCIFLRANIGRAFIYVLPHINPL